MAMTCTRWADAPATGDAAVRRATIAGTGAHLKRVEIAAGTTAGRHDHPFEQFVIVESGSGSLTTADGTIALEPGLVIHFPPGTWHEAVFATATVLLEVNLAPA
ncbi:cupin domain-containing protein [Novispirillum sp. DQ9]|uniref:cupin domain-containing protein n=1 Tax=Novispirillum sp. DQ9 TaxID=3398612 RepID=UPI003C7C2F20